jgi:hypothetical protein
MPDDDQVPALFPLPSLADAHDASPDGGCDASAAAARDASAELDTTRRARPPDASAPVMRDASAEVLNDAFRCGGEGELEADETPERPCAWCSEPIPPRARRDSICCSKRCRQARHRFARAAGRALAASGSQPVRLAYADPPYPGKAYYYRGHPDYAGEVDHAALIRRLSTYDGWALSTSAEALPAVLALCPPGVRVAAWHRGERPTASWHPLHAWEPVIYVPGRPADPSRADPRRVDSIVCGVSPLLTLPGRVVGTKPPRVCSWIFGLMGARAGDTLDDLFPGSGAVGRAWAVYTAGAVPA